MRQVIWWQEEARPAYTTAMEQHARRGQLCQTIEADEVDAVGSLLQDIVMDAAAKAGMLQTVRVGKEHS